MQLKKENDVLNGTATSSIDTEWASGPLSSLFNCVNIAEYTISVFCVHWPHSHSDCGSMNFFISTSVLCDNNSNNGCWAVWFFFYVVIEIECIR